MSGISNDPTDFSSFDMMGASPPSPSNGAMTSTMADGGISDHSNTTHPQGLSFGAYSEEMKHDDDDDDAVDARGENESLGHGATDPGVLDDPTQDGRSSANEDDSADAAKEQDDNDASLDPVWADLIQDAGEKTQKALDGTKKHALRLYQEVQAFVRASAAVHQSFQQVQESERAEATRLDGLAAAVEGATATPFVAAAAPPSDGDMMEGMRAAP